MTATVSGLLASARVVSIPLRTKFRSLGEREMLIFEGPNGFAEWSPFLEYSDSEAARWLSGAIEWAYEPLPKTIRDRVLVNAILPDVPQNDVEKVLARAGDFETLKIKVAGSGSAEADLSRIELAHSLFPNANLRLDANGGFAIEQALELIESLKAKGITLEYFEQPVKSIGELRKLREIIEVRGLGTLIAADESVRLESDPIEVARLNAADLLVLKSGPLGGIKKALEISNSVNLPVVPSGALQSSIGLAADLHFACSLGELNYACGFGTLPLMAGDLVGEPLRPEKGVLELRRPELKTSALDIFRAEDHRSDWWLERLERCALVLGLEA